MLSSRARRPLPISEDDLLNEVPLAMFSDAESLHQPNDENMSPIQDWIDECERKGLRGIADEYTVLRKIVDGTFESFKLPANKPKNRYTDVFCREQTRVVLKVEADGETDYIHANHVDGYKQRKAYICTQGPKSDAGHSTFPEFWRMIWQEKVLIIVMTTRLIEQEKPKSGQYWPVILNKNYKYNHLTVSSRKTVETEDYDLTYLLIKNTRTQRSRWVLHLLYHAWPDMKVPRNPVAFLEFQSFVRRLQQTMLKSQHPLWQGHPMGPPIVIHCSAGIGRTGTYCAIEICMQRLLETGKINVQDTVKKIRQQRVNSIQTPSQYIFIHLVLIEYAVQANVVPIEEINVKKLVSDGEQKTPTEQT